MPDKKRHNPFEEHIESESFDISQLGDSVKYPFVNFALQDYIDSLPQPLDYHLWDEKLDEQQKQLCAHLATEIVDRVLRPQFQDDLNEMTDGELEYMLMAPIALSMLVEENFHQKTTPPEKPAPAQIEIEDTDLPEWAKVVGQAARDVRQWVSKQFKKFKIKRYS